MSVTMRSLFIMAIITVVAGCTSSEPDSQRPPEFPRVSTLTADRGRVVYAEKCEACHGADGTAGIAGAANLKTSHLDSIAAAQQVSGGKNAMPAFKGQLSDEETGQVVHYVLGLRK